MSSPNDESTSTSSVLQSTVQSTSQSASSFSRALQSFLDLADTVDGHDQDDASFSIRSELSRLPFHAEHLRQELSDINGDSDSDDSRRLDRYAAAIRAATPSPTQQSFDEKLTSRLTWSTSGSITRDALDEAAVLVWKTNQQLQRERDGRHAQQEQSDDIDFGNDRSYKRGNRNDGNQEEEEEILFQVDFKSDKDTSTETQWETDGTNEGTVDGSNEGTVDDNDDDDGGANQEEETQRTDGEQLDVDCFLSCSSTRAVQIIEDPDALPGREVDPEIGGRQQRQQQQRQQRQQQLPRSAPRQVPYTPSKSEEDIETGLKQVVKLLLLDPVSGNNGHTRRTATKNTRYGRLSVSIDFAEPDSEVGKDSDRQDSDQSYDSGNVTDEKNDLACPYDDLEDPSKPTGNTRRQKGHTGTIRLSLSERAAEFLFGEVQHRVQTLDGRAAVLLIAALVLLFLPKLHQATAKPVAILP